MIGSAENKANSAPLELKLGLSLTKSAKYHQRNSVAATWSAISKSKYNIFIIASVILEQSVYLSCVSLLL